MKNEFQINYPFNVDQAYSLNKIQQFPNFIQQLPQYTPTFPNSIIHNLYNFNICSGNQIFMTNNVDRGFNFYPSNPAQININNSLKSGQSFNSYYLNSNVMNNLLNEQIIFQNKMVKSNYINCSHNLDYLGGKRTRGKENTNINKDINTISFLPKKTKKKYPFFSQKIKKIEKNEKKMEDSRDLTFKNNVEIQIDKKKWNNIFIIEKDFKDNKDNEIKSKDKSSNKRENKNKNSIQVESLISKHEENSLEKIEPITFNNVSIVINNTSEECSKIYPKFQDETNLKKIQKKNQTLTNKTEISQNIEKENDLSELNTIKKTKCLFHGENYIKTLSMSDFMKYNFDFEEETNFKKNTKKITKEDCVDFNKIMENKNIEIKDLSDIKVKWLFSHYNGNCKKLREEINEIESMIKYKNREPITDENCLDLLVMNDYNIKKFMKSIE